MAQQLRAGTGWWDQVDPDDSVGRTRLLLAAIRYRAGESCNAIEKSLPGAPAGSLSYMLKRAGVIESKPRAPKPKPAPSQPTPLAVTPPAHPVDPQVRDPLETRLPVQDATPPPPMARPPVVRQPVAPVVEPEPEPEPEPVAVTVASDDLDAVPAATLAEFIRWMGWVPEAEAFAAGFEAARRTA